MARKPKKVEEEQPELIEEPAEAPEEPKKAPQATGRKQELPKGAKMVLQHKAKLAEMDRIRGK